MSRRRSVSNAMPFALLKRGGGECAGCFCTQSEPFQAHVSPYKRSASQGAMLGSVFPRPPNTIVSLRTGSYPMKAPFRQAGAVVAGVACTQVGEAPSVHS